VSGLQDRQLLFSCGRQPVKHGGLENETGASGDVVQSLCGFKQAFRPLSQHALVFRGAVLQFFLIASRFPQG